MLFLTRYVTINTSAAIETRVAEPSYRPQIMVPWWIALLGALGSIRVMIVINPLAWLGSMLLVGLVSPQ